MKTPTRRELEVLEAYVREGSTKGAAHALGISVQTCKNHLTGLYHALGVTSNIAAMGALGWVNLPGDAPKACGWIGFCSRPRGHRGHHGGMRALPVIDEDG